MNRLFILLSIIFTLILSACASITTPICATSNPVGTKIGEASSTWILGMCFDGGDMSILKAARNGGITKISTVDQRYFSVLGVLVVNITTIVTGE